MHWFVRVVLTLALCLALAVGLLFLVPSERVAAIASREFEQATGRALRFTGPIRPVLWPQLGIRAGEVELANAGWSAEGPMMRADGLLVGIDVAPLLLGHVRLSRIIIDRPRLLLERNAAGRANWEFQGNGQGDFSLAHGALTDGTVTFIDRLNGRRRVFDAVNADFRLPDYHGAARLSVKAMWEGQPLTLTAGTAEFGAFRAGDSVPVEAELTGDALRLGFQGMIGGAPAGAKGRLRLATPDAMRAAALLGGQPVGEPSQALRLPVTLEGDLDWVPGRAVTLTEGVLSLDADRLSGGMMLDLAGPRPRFAVTLNGAVFNAGALLPRLIAETSESWSPAPVAYDWLQKADGVLDLRVERLLLSGAVFGPAALHVALDRGRAVATLADVGAYGGKLSGELVMNGRSGLSVGGDLRVTDMALRPLFADLGEAEFAGALTGSLKFLGVGNTPAAIMNSLSGEGQLAIVNGRLAGVDLAAATLGHAPVGRLAVTPFTNLTARFAMKDGVLLNDDLTLDAPTLTASGSGVIGIGPGTWNYRLLPHPREAGLGRLRPPVLVTGTWIHPEIRLSLPTATEEAVAAERARLEQEGR
ncbi:AsmA family protein [Haematobacter genomosp. 1]|uniref:AsmA domain-containing protein n=1 Tax=Haematobacter genomosp. 1 TaxID=366618 RepID=A0A212A8N3_9RHOB|nr:AsmA family protein [Haematobacter genomosp. 1]OWJ76183.1 hypothetical protein CDV49_15340 [Haematobacter genomosp. 1]